MSDVNFDMTERERNQVFVNSELIREETYIKRIIDLEKQYESLPSSVSENGKKITLLSNELSNTNAKLSENNEGLIALEDCLNNHIANHPSGGNNSQHIHENMNILDSITNEKVKEWNEKANNNHSHNYNELTNKPNIPSIVGLASELYVQNKIAEAQLSGGDVDLSGLATKDELNLKSDRNHTHIEMHSHSNKSVLDSITSTKVNEWNNKSSFSGSYNDLTNKPLEFNPASHRHNASDIDGVSGSFIDDWGTLVYEGGSGTTPIGGFPDGYSTNYVKFNNNYWAILSNDTDMNSVKVGIVNGRLTANKNVNYKYSSNNGASWNLYDDAITINVAIVLEASVDIYNDTFTTVTRQKDDIGTLIQDVTEVSMVNGNTKAIAEYVGTKAQLVIDTDKNEIRIMDGVTKGGHALPSSGGGESVDLSDYYTKSQVETKLSEKSDTSHIHTGYANSTHRHDASDIDNLPTGNGGSWIGAKSVLDFGAQPLSDTGGQPSSSAFDNTNAIQQAIEWSNTNRATVYFPRGRYVVKGTLYLKEYCSFLGDNQLPFGYEPYGNWNKNDVVILCQANVVFRGYGKTDASSSLHPTELALRGMNFQVGDPSDSNMINSIFFHKIQLNRSDIRYCLFRGFGIWLMGTMFMKTYVERCIFMETRKYFIQSLDIPNIGNQAGIVDSKVMYNYISGSQTGVNNVAFFINYPAFSEVKGNFIDFWKLGFDVWQGEAFSVTDNDFQYCGKGVRVAGAGSFGIIENRFGKMNYSEHKSAFTNDVSSWGANWIGIELEDSINNCVVTNNIGSTVDTLIYARATNYTRLFVNANIGGTTIVNTNKTNDTTNKIFIQEFR